MMPSDLDGMPSLPSPAPQRPADGHTAGGLAAFLEAKNIAALHVVGSLMLLAGLGALIRWQWGTPAGKGMVLALLLLLTAGTRWVGGRISGRQPVSGLVLLVLSALIAPLNLLAANAFGVWGRVLSGDVVGFAAALVCAGLYLHTLYQTRHPLFAAFTIAAIACAAGFAARLVLPGQPAHLTCAAGFLPAGALFFAVAHRLRREQSPLSPLFLAAGHGLILLIVLQTLLRWPFLWAGGSPATALVAAGIAVLYGVVALAFRSPAAAYVAALAFALAGPLLQPEGVWEHDRALVGALAALLLHAVAFLHRRFAASHNAFVGSGNPYQRAALFVSVAAALPLLPVLMEPVAPLGMAGIFCLLALSWTLAAAEENVSDLLYPAVASLLVALRLAAGPLADWGAHRFAWEPNETRWLLVAVPVLAPMGWIVRERLARPGFARPLFHAALTAALWAGMGQAGLLFSGSTRVAASAIPPLWLLAAGLAVYAVVARRLSFAAASLAPASLAYLASLVLWGGASLPGIGAAALLGACWLRIASEHDRPLYAWTGGAALFLACAHAVFALLPAPARAAWALCLLPAFVLLLALGAAAPSLRRPLHALALALPAACLALFLLSLSSDAWLLRTLLAYALFYVAAAFLRSEAVWLYAGVGVATLGEFLGVGGYPYLATPLAPGGFSLAVLACVWLSSAVLLAPRRPEFARAMSNAGLTVATIGAGLALAGMGAEWQGRWTVYALMVTGTLYAVIAALRQSPGWVHAAFALYFAAFALFLFDAVSLSMETADFYLIPVGLYLIENGWLVARTRRDAGGRQAAQRFYAAGLFLALTPTFLAAWLDAGAAWFHSFLLVAECVGAIYFGIISRIRVFLGVGAGFLIALLVITGHEPMLQVHWGIYLTALGAAIVASAVFFEKRRADVLRWAHAARAAFEDWE